MSFADYFRFDATTAAAIGVLVSVVAVFAMVSLLIIQLRGLGIIVSEMSYGTDLAGHGAIWISAIADGRCT